MPQIESDFSLRKMKIAGAVLLGSMFASSMLPMMALTLVQAATQAAPERPIGFATRSET